MGLGSSIYTSSSHLFNISKASLKSAILMFPNSLSCCWLLTNECSGDLLHAFSPSIKSSRYLHTPYFFKLISGFLLLNFQGMCSSCPTSVGGVWPWMCWLFFTCSSANMGLGSVSTSGRVPNMRVIFLSSTDRSIIRSWLLMRHLSLRFLSTSLISHGSWLHLPTLKRWVLSAS